MQPERDDLKDSYYLRLIRTGIGEGLRNYYDLTEPLPDNLLERLLELDQEPDDVPNEARKP